MMNLELGGCEPLFGCFPDWSFFFLRRLSLRGMFRLFYAAYKGANQKRKQPKTIQRNATKEKKRWMMWMEF